MKGRGRIKGSSTTVVVVAVSIGMMINKTVYANLYYNYCI